MDKVRIGLIGAGGVARARHLPRLAAIDEVELAVVWSRDGAKAAEVASEFGIGRVVGDWRDVVESPEVDAVIVATPPVNHLPATLAALSAGKHVLCQARMARNLQEARRMLAAARESGLVTALYPPMPGLRGDRVVRRLLADGDYVGEIREVRVAGLAHQPPGDDYVWQIDPEVAGLNTMTMGMWAEVLNRWVGPARSLSATATSHLGSRATALGGLAPATVPDSIAISADLECGATASYHFSTHASFAPPQAIEIYGTRGAIHYTMFGDVVRGATAGDDAMHEIEVADDEVRLQTTDAEFVRAILHGGPIEPDFEEGVRYMEFTEAVAISAHTGEAVAMPPEPMMEGWGQPLG